MSDKPVVLILAAGLGTRMKSERAKVLHPVAGRPLILWAIETARAAGAARVVAILGHQLEEVRRVIDERYGAGVVAIAHQTTQRGTGDAVRAAMAELAGEPERRTIVITTGDAPLLTSDRIRELAAACEATPAKLALLATRPPTAMPYGRLVRDAAGKLLQIVEDKDASPAERAIEEMNAGFYAIRLGHLRADLERLTTDNAQGELYLTDLAAAAAARGGAAVIDAPWDEVAGINDRVDLAAVELAARRLINHGWMRAGVTIVAPDHTFISPEVGPIGADTVIGPGVTLAGKTEIGRGVRLDTGAVLTDVIVADAAWIKPYSVLEQAQVGERTQVGPFAHCRPGTVLESEVRIGNFVETKKAHFQSGAKANHLSYLGDASIGARANIGAGTITCNYDGFGKYKTTIEAGAFIGSDTQLVAPVTVGRDAYVGSGTTVTKDVPRSALAISRTKQQNVEGWAERFRAAQGKRNRGGKDEG